MIPIDRNISLVFSFYDCSKEENRKHFWKHCSSRLMIESILFDRSRFDCTSTGSLYPEVANAGDQIISIVTFVVPVPVPSSKLITHSRISWSRGKKNSFIDVSRDIFFWYLHLGYNLFSMDSISRFLVLANFFFVKLRKYQGFPIGASHRKEIKVWTFRFFFLLSFE